MRCSYCTRKRGILVMRVFDTVGVTLMNCAEALDVSPSNFHRKTSIIYTLSIMVGVSSTDLKKETMKSTWKFICSSPASGGPSVNTPGSGYKLLQNNKSESDSSRRSRSNVCSDSRFFRQSKSWSHTIDLSCSRALGKRRWHTRHTLWGEVPGIICSP